jgi:hypothetical protein
VERLQKQILRLDVAMDDTDRVGGAEGREDLPRVLDRLARRQHAPPVELGRPSLVCPSPVTETMLG